jgi:hypothetical protein
LRTIDLRNCQPDSLYVDVRFDPRLEKPDQFLVLETMEVYLPDGRSCTIYVGFISDGASVPVAIQNIAPAIDNQVLLAYVLHDYLYIEWEKFDPDQTIQNPRHYADCMMYWAMRQAAPERWFRNWAYYAMVRIFGEKKWNEHRKKARSQCL